MKLGLQLKCDLNNIAELSASGDDFRWYVQSKCGNCGQHTPDFIYVCASERVALKDSRGDTNLTIRCKFCNRTGHVDVLTETYAPYTAEDSGHYKTVAVFECRGVELTAFSPRVGWSAKGLESGTVFNDISLSDNMPLVLFIRSICNRDDRTMAERIGVYLHK